jgi:hypothetical protein
LPTCQSTKICQRHQGNQLPMCWQSEKQELVDAPERVTPLALETWNWDAMSTSNDTKLNL